MAKTPKDLGLDFAKFRPGQLAVARVLERASEKRVNKLKAAIKGTKYSRHSKSLYPTVTFMNAPTGSGKSLLIATLQALTKSRIVVLTKTKQLQEQYSNSFKGILNIKGKANYQSELFPYLNVAEAPCQAGWNCPARYRCEYFVERSRMESAPFVVTNYDYGLPTMNYVETLKNIDILVCDEGHLVEDILLDFAEIGISKAFYQERSILLPKNTESLDSWKAWAAEVYPSIQNEHEKLQRDVTALGEALNLSSFEGIATMNFGVEHTDLIRHYERVKRAYDNVLRLYYLNTDWFVEESPRRYSIKPIWGTGLFANYLGQHAERSILMSATLAGADKQAQILGIEDYQYLDIPSLWPVKNRPLKVYPVVNMTNETMKLDKTLAKLTAAIDKILDKHSGVKGICHVTNYRTVEYILKHSRHRDRLLSHTTEDRTTKLDFFTNTKLPMVMVSPSFHIGVDIPDQIVFQIGAKTPFPSLQNKRVRIRMEQDPDWYIMQTANILAQQYGRGVRCLDLETEVLTDTGWKRYNEMNVGDTVYGIPEWVYSSQKAIRDGSPPLKPHKVQDITINSQLESLIGIKAKGLDIKVTPDHSIVFQPRKVAYHTATTRRNGKEYFYKKSYRKKATPLSKCSIAETPSRFKIPLAGRIGRKRTGLPDDWYWLMGMIISDGWLSRTKSEVGISQSKPNIIDKIDKKLNSLNIRHSRYIEEYRGTESIGGYIRNYDRARWQITGFDAARIRDIFYRGRRRSYPTTREYSNKEHRGEKGKRVKGWYTPEKTIPRWVLNRSSIGQLLSLLEGLMDGDGSWYNTKLHERYTGTYFTSSKQLADGIQEMLVLCGFRSSLVERRSQYEIRFTKRAYADCVKSKAVYEAGEEQTWCIATDLGSFVARRNGKTFITGNSPNWKSAFYMLDQQFLNFYRRGAKYLPSHVRKAIKIYGG